MAYDAMTPSGSQVNAQIYKAYQDHVIDVSSQGMQPPTFDQWYQMQMKAAQQKTQDDAGKYY